MIPPLTWTCHVCFRERDDAQISVVSHRFNYRGVPITRNVRYCNDDPDCTDKAQKYQPPNDRKDTHGN